MATKDDTRSTGSWEILVRHDGSESQELETTISNALLRLDSGTEGKPLYDYIDLEAAAETLGRGRGGWGASEIRFEYEDYEIRITDDGTVAAREQPDTAEPHL